ncbi:NfeD family protein [Methylobacter sp. BlB1]|jgi:hypothetical protein|uniref:NfeD family protein n=1 Tax=Methylobacter sp. BlB1 TaxID=2785914 RepID=UPI001E595310|nr:hypothetical protein [Methylobacter sp. BlB1]
MKIDTNKPVKEKADPALPQGVSKEEVTKNGSVLRGVLPLVCVALIALQVLLYNLSANGPVSESITGNDPVLGTLTTNLMRWTNLFPIFIALVLLAFFLIIPSKKYVADLSAAAIAESDALIKSAWKIILKVKNHEEDFIVTEENWWSAALVLITIELLVPGFYFIGLASAGFVTGCLLFLIPTISFDIQVAIFSIISVLINQIILY